MITDEQLQSFYIDQYPVQTGHTEMNVKFWEYIEKFEPASVFEFGCNCGKNLFHLKTRIPDLYVAGSDINKRAIDLALAPNLTLGGVRHLKERAQNAKRNQYQFDIGFTCSVLCHMNEIKSVIDSLKLMCRTVMLLETNEKRDWNYIAHDYESYGFEEKWSHKQLGGNQCTYTCYQTNK